MGLLTMMLPGPPMLLEPASVTEEISPTAVPEPTPVPLRVIVG